MPLGAYITLLLAVVDVFLSRLLSNCGSLRLSSPLGLLSLWNMP